MKKPKNKFFKSGKVNDYIEYKREERIMPPKK